MNPWFLHGEFFSHGTGTGVFALTNGAGNTGRYDSFREITMLIEI